MSIRIIGSEELEPDIFDVGVLYFLKLKHRFGIWSLTPNYTRKYSISLYYGTCSTVLMGLKCQMMGPAATMPTK
jgi:hypothetical protein